MDQILLVGVVFTGIFGLFTAGAALMIYLGGFKPSVSKFVPAATRLTFFFAALCLIMWLVLNVQPTELLPLDLRRGG